MENQTTNEVSNTSTSITSEVKQVSKTELTAMVNSGKKKDEIASYYNLNANQTTKLLQSAGLKIRKFSKPSFLLVD